MNNRLQCLLILVASFPDVTEASMENADCAVDACDDASESKLSLLQTQIAISRQLDVRQDAKFKDERRHSNIEFKPEMFQGCSHIFIDLGSNRGTHIRKLFEAHKYPGTPYLPLFDQGFGLPAWRNRSSTETGICAFGFEANPQWQETLSNISDAYAKQGWRATWFAPAFVSNHSGDSETFWLNGNAAKRSDWAASGTQLSPLSTSVQVPNVDISSFMEMMNKYANPGHRLMKMDIESAEFIVFPAFLKKKLLCKGALDILTIEWHDNARYMGADKLKRAEQTKKAVLAPGKCGVGEDTLIIDFDDESYLDDGMPLP